MGGGRAPRPPRFRRHWYNLSDTFARVNHSELAIRNQWTGLIFGIKLLAKLLFTNQDKKKSMRYPLNWQCASAVRMKRSTLCYDRSVFWPITSGPVTLRWSKDIFTWPLTFDLLAAGRIQLLGNNAHKNIPKLPVLMWNMLLVETTLVAPHHEAKNAKVTISWNNRVKGHCLTG